MVAIENSSSTAILNAALKELQNQGLIAYVDSAQFALGRTHPDATVRIAYGANEPSLYAVEIKRWVTPATLGAISGRMRDLGPARLLITDYVTPQVALKLKELDIAFADTAGNAYLRGPNFLVWFVGARRPVNQHMRGVGRAWQPTGLKLIFALLCNPDWVELGYRDLAARTGVSNGTVGWVMRELGEQGFLIQIRRGKKIRRLRNRRKLLDRWAEIYASTFRRTTLLGCYQTENTDWWRTLDTLKYDALIGGEPAGAILTEFLKPGTTTIYVRAAPAAMVLDQRLRVAEKGNVEIRQRFWPFDYDWNHPNLTPPVLVYADLLATGDARCIETAHRVYDGYLVGFIGQE